MAERFLQTWEKFREQPGGSPVPFWETRNLTRRQALFLMVSLGLLPRVDRKRTRIRWLVYYSNKAPLEAFNDYSTLILDSQYHPTLVPLARKKKQLIGYLSVGEVSAQNPLFPELKAEGILLQENKNWPGNLFVDVRNHRWPDRVCNYLIPQMLNAGFHGVFLDTLDNPSYLERLDAAKYAGMAKAAANLVCRIRSQYRKIKIVMNRAYEILPWVEHCIDIMVGESVFATYDFKSGSYRLVHPDLYQQQVRLLKEARARRPWLQVFTLDYWDPTDSAGIARIYREQCSNGFEPYVATIALDRIVPEPKF